MIESSRRHGHFDPRGHSNGSRPSGVLIAAAENGDAVAGLEWYAFSSRYFPGRRRHDLGAVKAYEAYLSDHPKAERDQAEAVQMGNVMIKCTESGEGVPAGFRIDAASFETSNLSETVTCPHCGQEHTWSTKDAWIEHVY